INTIALVENRSTSLKYKRRKADLDEIIFEVIMIWEVINSQMGVLGTEQYIRITI
ncbi:hypothetical protein ACTXT7_012994, partial [Hymenolepis weldensis]